MATEVQSTESMEAFCIEVTAEVGRVLDARLKTIEAKMDRLCAFVTVCEALAEQLQASPMFQMMSAGDGAGLGFFGQ